MVLQPGQMGGPFICLCRGPFGFCLPWGAAFRYRFGPDSFRWDLVNRRWSALLRGPVYRADGGEGRKPNFFELIVASPGAQREGFNTETPLRSGQVPWVSVGYSRCVVAFLGLPAGFLALPALR